MTNEELALAVARLAHGEVVAAATETVFGLLADAASGPALERVFALKGRDAAKGVALLLPDAHAWPDLVPSIAAPAARLAERFWPGPLTIALAARAHLDERLTVSGTVGVRWPGASDAALITKAFGRPVTATSANLAGAPPASSATEVERAFGEACERGDLTVVSGVAKGGAPSTLVVVSANEVRIVRRGAIDESALAAALEGTGISLIG